MLNQFFNKYDDISNRIGDDRKIIIEKDIGNDVMKKWKEDIWIKMIVVDPYLNILVRVFSFWQIMFKGNLLIFKEYK